MTEPAIAIEEHGGGQPLVLVHGLGTSQAIWHRVIPELARDRRVVLVDIPGFGESEPLGEGFEFDEVALAIDNVIAERVNEPYDLLGTSLGGALALTLATERPASVRRLVLAAPAGFHPHHPIIAVAAGHVGAAIVRVRRELGRHLVRRASARRALLWRVVHDAARLPASDAHLMLSASRTARRIREATQTAAGSDLLPLIRRVNTPVGLLWGEHDHVVPIANSRGMTAARPELPFETVRDAGHVPHLERPNEWTAAVRRLLDRLANP